MNTSDFMKLINERIPKMFQIFREFNELGVYRQSYDCCIQNWLISPPKPINC